MKLMHISLPEESLVACGEDRLPGMKLGTRQEVWDADEAGCFACVDAYDEAGYMTASFRSQGRL